MNCDVPALWLEHKEALYYFIFNGFLMKAPPKT